MGAACPPCVPQSVRVERRRTSSVCPALRPCEAPSLLACHAVRMREAPTVSAERGAKKGVVNISPPRWCTVQHPGESFTTSLVKVSPPLFTPPRTPRPTAFQLQAGAFQWRRSDPTVLLRRHPARRERRERAGAGRDARSGAAASTDRGRATGACFYGFGDRERVRASRASPEDGALPPSRPRTARHWPASPHARSRRALSRSGWSDPCRGRW